jgi:hypothetical protein
MTTVRNCSSNQFSARASAVLLLGLALLGQGCAATGTDLSDADAAGEGEPVAVAESAITTLSTWSDWSGTVTVTLYSCGWSTAGTNPSASCTVPSTDAITGGGAVIQGNSIPGALLTESYPGADRRTWYVKSKDNSTAYSHSIHAYAIGLRLAGVSAETLRSQMSRWDTRSCMGGEPAKSRPTVTSVGTPANNIMVGGGARTEYTGAGQYLTDSYPRTTWFPIPGTSTRTTSVSRGAQRVTRVVVSEAQWSVWEAFPTQLGTRRFRVASAGRTRRWPLAVPPAGPAMAGCLRTYTQSPPLVAERKVASLQSRRTVLSPTRGAQHRFGC